MNIKNMTLEQKIGQMIMAGFPSDSYDEHLAEIIEKHHIGNIILFARNVRNKHQIAELTRSIQEKAMKHNGIPAIISIDQEGGMVTRIYEGATFLPGNMATAASGVKDATYMTGTISGKELRALGINMNIAPVMDVNNNPDNPVIGVRSYGDDPEVVGKMGAGYIKGLQENGVIATAKHFPGHGDTSVDSHLDLPLVPHPIKRLEKVELYPFRKAIESGVDAIMSAHVLFPAFEDENLPATLSYKVLTGLLRERSGFKGLIITDCMEMNAIAAYFGTSEAAAMAVKAGADIMCVSHSKDLQIESMEVIKEAVLKGEIPESRIDESVARIVKIKKKYGLFRKPYPDMDGIENLVGCSEHLEVAERISLRSITIVKDEKGLIPVKDKKILAISTDPVILTGINDEIKRKNTFYDYISWKFGGRGIRMTLNPSTEEIASITKKAGDAELIIVGTYNANLNPGQAELVKELYKLNSNVIVVALRNPYDILKFKEIPAYVCAYEYTPISLESTAKVLYGKFSPEGQLPVTIDIGI